MRKLNKKEKLTFKKFTKNKFTKKVAEDKQVFDKDDYSYSFKIKKNKIKLHKYHRMGCDDNYIINKKGKLKIT